MHNAISTVIACASVIACTSEEKIKTGNGELLCLDINIYPNNNVNMMICSDEKCKTYLLNRQNWNISKSDDKTQIKSSKGNFGYYKNSAYSCQYQYSGITEGLHSNLDLCLQPVGGYNGADVDAKECKPGVPQQEWQWDSDQNMFKWVANPEYCLDVHRPDWDQSRNKGRVQLWECKSDDPSMKWTV